ncbi:DUF4012 domain-containing protein [Agromyces intestinalis]|uniref:DUF4012 domain-containing protein n=1 Tax=Agromyces intestinalis TaxID=2592652 RepID=A0A5C1YEL9_9MICO|nr:DUF4012 domain-containing protein [Agromyces intestinalis]QEO14128.1 DUF4012 domain-containing protein [Agromyces intestinalis]
MTRAPRAEAPAPRRRRLRVVLGVLVLAAVAVTAAAAWIGVRALTAKQELEAAVPVVERIVDVAQADPTELGDSIDELTAHTARAVELTDDPVWRTAEHLPWIGDDLAAVRTLAAVGDRLAQHVAKPLVGVAGQLSGDGLRIRDGRFDPAPLAALGSAASGVGAELADAANAVAAIDREGLVSPVAHARDRLSDLLEQARPYAEAISTAGPLIAPMLGLDGPRDYLVLILNNAEVRATGGIPGALAVVHVEDGTMDLEPIRSNSDIPAFDAPILPLGTATADLYGSLPGRFVQDVTMTPDFDETARLARAFWAGATGVQVDGVIAVDPGVLAAFLRAIGAVEVDGLTLTADDVVRQLLVDSYLRIDDQGTLDAFFADVGHAVFAAVTSGGHDPRSLVDAAVSSAQDGRISIWSAHPDEQAVLADTALGGPLAALDAAGPDSYGVYLNDATGGKFDPFLDLAVDAGTVECRADGRQEVVVRVTATSTAPNDAWQSLPRYVTAGRPQGYGVDVGVMAVDVAVYGAPGSYQGSVLVDGERVPAATTTDDGRPVAYTRIQMLPGRTSVLEVRYVASEPGAVRPVVRHTPTVGPVTVGTWEPACEAQ